MTPRGIRNHNPGNVRHGDRWQGLAAEQPDPAFCTFKAPEWGIRAICRLLLNYKRKHGLDTVRGIIGRWAPPNENDTDAYVRAVARRIGVDPDARLRLDAYAVMRPLVEAIITHENGQQPYERAVIDKGLSLAGIDVPASPAPKATPRAGLLAAILDLILKLFGRLK